MESLLRCGHSITNNKIKNNSAQTKIEGPITDTKIIFESFNHCFSTIGTVLASEITKCNQ